MEAFTDGVIAVIITIMVLELKLPHAATWRALLADVPVFLSYVLSFVYVGIYWNNHHHMLQMVSHVSGFADSLMTGSIGFPITLPCPVGNRCTTAPEAAHSVTASAAADEVSMYHKPLPVGASAGSRQPTYLHFFPIF